MLFFLCIITLTIQRRKKGVYKNVGKFKKRNKIIKGIIECQLFRNSGTFRDSKK